MTLAEELLDSTVETYAGPEVDPEERDFDALDAGRRARSSASIDAELDGVDFDGMTPGRDHRRALGADPPEVREQGSADPDRDPAPRRARHHAADRRRAVEGPPLQPRPPQGRHRPARLRPARSARRVQEGELRALHGDEGSRRGRDRPLPVAADAGRGDDGAGTAAPMRPAQPRRPPQQITLNSPSRAAPVTVRRDRRQRGRPAAPSGAPARRAPAATT